ncbi:MAG: DUF559 domain-containing protein, partial [Candidatus Aenigmarchaeota archaeon]|nr:DUF559 domain-containing protein [Candidatus Aenigmarchaeota archaeon]
YNVNDPRAPMPVISTHPLCFIDWQVPVFTVEGYKPIGKIKVGDLVLTKEGKFRKVTKLFFGEKYKGEVISIYYSQNNNGKYDNFITVTPEHPIMTKDGYKKASTLTEEDELMVRACKCKNCGQLMSKTCWSGSEYCSMKCAQTHTAKIQWKEKRDVMMEAIHNRPDYSWNRGLTAETDERVKQNAEAISMSWNDDWRETMKIIMSGDKNPAKRPEVRKKISDYKKEFNPMFIEENRDKMAVSQKKRLESPEAREELGKAIRQHNINNPGMQKEKYNEWIKNNPEEFNEKCTKQGVTMKKLYKEHPEKHPNYILAKNGGISKPQKEMFDFILKEFPEAILNMPIKTKVSMRFGDVVLEKEKIIAEFDGKYWHQDTEEEDRSRDIELGNVGYNVLHVNEDNWQTINTQIHNLMANHNDEYLFTYTKVKKVKRWITRRIVNLYNFEVEEFNNYIAKGIVVHNCNCAIRPYFRFKKEESDKK